MNQVEMVVPKPRPYPVYRRSNGGKRPLCANCGTPNHMYRQCNHPVTSFGVVAVRLVPDDTGAMVPEYLMVQRKDSLSYGTFLRGKYSINMRNYLLQLFGGMTSAERAGLVQHDFDTLWKQLWQVDACNSHMREYEDARSKFDTLQRGYYVRSSEDDDLVYVDLRTLLDATKPPEADETEWGFPKGRRNINEDDATCALREFSEETAVPVRALRLVPPFKPFEEVFTGSNGVRYRHVYYLAVVTEPVLCNPALRNIEPGSRLQRREVSNVAWFTFDEALAKIRPHNVERRELFKRMHAAVCKTLHLTV